MHKINNNYDRLQLYHTVILLLHHFLLYWLLPSPSLLLPFCLLFVCLPWQIFSVSLQTKKIVNHSWFAHTTLSCHYNDKGTLTLYRCVLPHCIPGVILRASCRCCLRLGNWWRCRMIMSFSITVFDNIGGFCGWRRFCCMLFNISHCGCCGSHSALSSLILQCGYYYDWSYKYSFNQIHA